MKSGKISDIPTYFLLLKDTTDTRCGNHNVRGSDFGPRRVAGY
jgi:hypothetical protein